MLQHARTPGAHWRSVPAMTAQLSVGPLESWMKAHDFDFLRPAGWTPLQCLLFSLAVMAALGFLNNIVPLLFRGFPSIPAQGSHAPGHGPAGGSRPRLRLLQPPHRLHLSAIVLYITVRGSFYTIFRTALFCESATYSVIR